MALTIDIEGKGVIANCDALTNDTGGSGVDDWLELGGGQISDEADAFLYGTTSIGNKYASKSGWTYFNMATALDFDTGGSEVGQFIYIWLNIAAPNAFDTLANKGFAIRIGNSTTVYREFIIAGEDDSNGWSGGWKLFVIDPTKTGSVADTGTFDVGAVDLIGIWIDTNSSVRADSIFIDQVAVGKGLRITGTWDSGTYSGAWEEVVAYCTDYSNRAWGMLQERDGIYYAFGKFYIGDTTQSANTLFEDSGKVIQFGTSQYYISGGWASTMPVDACGIVVEDHATYKTDFTDGVIVGTDNGRSGSVIIGNADQDVVMDLYGGNNAASATLCYGTTFKGIKGAFNSGNDAGHKFLGCQFLKCSQFDPVGAPVIRNCTFAETIDIDAAILWNENIDISDCKFIANTLGAGIEMPSAAGTPYSYSALFFSGNTYDVLNSSGSAISIGKTNLADPSTYEGSAVTFTASFTHKLTGVKENSEVTYTELPTADETGSGGSSVAGSRTFTTGSTMTADEYIGHLLVISSGADAGRYYCISNTTTTLKLDTELSTTASSLSFGIYGSPVVVYHLENVTSSGETSYTHSGGDEVDILIAHVDYVFQEIVALTLGNTNESIPVDQKLDLFYKNP